MPRKYTDHTHLYHDCVYVNVRNQTYTGHCTVLIRPWVGHIGRYMITLVHVQPRSQVLSSPLAPWEVKRRDPGNEVSTRDVYGLIISPYMYYFSQ